jgi:hypothetical protein
MNHRTTIVKLHGGDRRANTQRNGNGTCLTARYRPCENPKFGRNPDNWRDRLPRPAAYYGRCVQKLGKVNGAGWAQGICPFHDDHNKSLGVCINGGHGGWRCFAGCGGGDIVAFHRRLRGMTFNAAICDLIGDYA